MSPLGWAATALFVLHPSSQPPVGGLPGSPHTPVSTPAQELARDTTGGIIEAGRFITVKAPWDKDVETKINALLRRGESRLSASIGRPDRSSYEETFLAWDEMCGDLDAIGAFGSWDFNTSTDAAMRNRGEKTEELVSKINTRLYTLRFPYEVLRSTFARIEQSLSWDRKAFAKDTLRAFELNGVHLEGKAKERVQLISQEMIEIGVRFAKVLKDREVEVCLTPDQAKPIDPVLLRKDPKTGASILVLREDSYWDVLRRHPDADFRKLCYHRFYDATADQTADLDRLRALRREKAKQVKGKSFAALEMEDEGFTEEQVHSTLLELKKRTERWFLTTLEDYRQLNGGKPPKIWDLAYLEETAPTAGVAPGALLEYFSAQNVVKTLLGLARRLYGLSFERTTLDPLTRVEVFTVSDRSGKPIGRFTLDLYPRANKYSHAACWTMQGRATHHPDRQVVVGLVANLRERTLEGGKKGILFEEVQTIFHEFGHVLHGILIDSEPIGAHGVPRSLVEVPSQVFETWALDPVVLDEMALHNKTGKPLPADLRTVLYRKSARFAARHLRTQCLYSLFDLEFHDRTDEPIQEIWDRMTDDFFGKGFYPKKVPWFTRFGHLDGYGAKYWGYKFADLGKAQTYWSLVHRFRDLTAPEVGRFLEKSLMVFGGLKKLPEVATELTGLPLTPLPYVLDTLLDYPSLRAKIEGQAKAGRDFRSALEAAFVDLSGKASAR